MMNPKRSVALSSLLIAAGVMLAGGSCDSSSGAMGVTLVGRSPSDGAQAAAAAICERDARCGTVSISCTGGTTASTKCSAEFVYPVEADCISQRKPAIERLLGCAALTTAQIEMIKQCIDALVARACVTQAQADALVMSAMESMSLPPDPPPAECTFLEEPIPGCP
jgi:hypothetical protein